jgi:hypothetical protein
MATHDLPIRRPRDTVDEVDAGSELLMGRKILLYQILQLLRSDFIFFPHDEGSWILLSVTCNTSQYFSRGILVGGLTSLRQRLRRP